MTSFGRGESQVAGKRWVVELRSVNHRFLDIKVKMPRELAPLEERLKKMVSAAISRGHVDIFVVVDSASSATADLEVNLPLARAYFAALNDLQQEFDLPQGPSLELMAANDALIRPPEDGIDLDEAWKGLRDALEQALSNSQAMRQAEGLSLRDDLLERLETFETTVAEIEAAVPELLAERQAALKERLDRLLERLNVDEERLAQEVAIIADKSDITEELVRLKSHIGQFKTFMGLKEPVGRRLDFLLQEFLREINTTASKISNAETIHKTVFLKNEVEKMKEQVQNLE